jgi:D-xylulose reductase
MQALVLEQELKLSLRDFPTDDHLGVHDVRIAMHTVGICGSDLHYYQWGRSVPMWCVPR